MPHKRQLIRAAMVAQLVGPEPPEGEDPVYATPAENRVIASRKIPWRAKDLPAIGVYTLRETVDGASQQTAPRTLKRHLELVIEYAVRVPADAPASTPAPRRENVDDALDAGAAAIEVAVHADDTIGGTAVDAVLQGTEFILMMDGDQPIGVAQLTYDVVYETAAPELSDAELDDFLRLHARYALTADQAQADETQDLVAVAEEDS